MTEVNDQARIEANTKFASTLLLEAAEAVQQDQNPYEALQDARSRFLHEESQNEIKLRTYAFGSLMNDLRQFLIKHAGIDPDGFAPLNECQRALGNKATEAILRKAAETIPHTIEKRILTESMMERMSEKEFYEYSVMCKTVRFLTLQGIDIKIQWEREEPDAPLDYVGTVEGIPWKFELTQLRKDAKESHRKIGNPKEKKSLSKQLDELSNPLPHVDQDKDSLQAALDKAVAHARDKAHALEGAKICLVIHNRQFTYIPSWEQITWPGTENIDQVLILHEEEFTATQSWEVRHPHAFGPTLKSHGLSHLENQALARLLTDGNEEHAKLATEHIKEWNISEQAILEALEEVRNRKCASPESYSTPASS